MKEHNTQSNSKDTPKRFIFIGDLAFFKKLQTADNPMLKALWRCEIQPRFVLINKENPNELQEMQTWLKEVFHEWAFATDRYEWLKLGTTFRDKKYLIGNLQEVVTFLDSAEDIVQAVRYHSQGSKFAVNINLMADSELAEEVEMPLSISIYRSLVKNDIKPHVWAGWPGLYDKWINVYKSQYPEDLQTLPTMWIPIGCQPRLGSEDRILIILGKVQN